MHREKRGASTSNGGTAGGRLRLAYAGTGGGGGGEPQGRAQFTIAAKNIFDMAFLRAASDHYLLFDIPV